MKKILINICCCFSLASINAMDVPPTKTPTIERSATHELDSLVQYIPKDNDIFLNLSRQAEEEDLEQIQTLARAINIDISKYQKYVIDATSIIKANASDENKEKYRSWLSSPIESVITNIKDAMTERFILANDEYKIFEVFYEKLNEITNKKFGIQIVFKNDSIEITALTKTPTDKETGKTFGDIHSAIKSCCQTLGHDWIRQARLGDIKEGEDPNQVEQELLKSNTEFINELSQHIKVNPYIKELIVAALATSDSYNINRIFFTRDKYDYATNSHYKHFAFVRIADEPILYTSMMDFQTTALRNSSHGLYIQDHWINSLAHELGHYVSESYMDSHTETESLNISIPDAYVWSKFFRIEHKTDNMKQLLEPYKSYFGTTFNRSMYAGIKTAILDTADFTSLASTNFAEGWRIFGTTLRKDGIGNVCFIYNKFNDYRADIYMGQPIRTVYMGGIPPQIKVTMPQNVIEATCTLANTTYAEYIKQVEQNATDESLSKARITAIDLFTREANGAMIWGYLHFNDIPAESVGSTLALCFDMCNTKDEISGVYENIKEKLRQQRAFPGQTEEKLASIDRLEAMLEKEKDSRLALITE